MTVDSGSPSGDVAADVDRLQQVQPVTTMLGHEACADVHTVLHLAHTLLTSRDRRAFAAPGWESAESLVRELRAAGVYHASPELVAMVAIIDAAVDQLADAGAVPREDVWGQLHKEVLRRHCHNPDTEPSAAS
jgi:hypothetical protein